MVARTDVGLGVVYAISQLFEQIADVLTHTCSKFGNNASSNTSEEVAEIKVRD